MSRDLPLAQNQKDIHGRFWFHDDPANAFHGLVKLEAGKKPVLEISQFGGPRAAEMLRNAPAKRAIHGHDEHGRALTLLDCHSPFSRSTMVMVTHRYICRAAIIGEAIPPDDIQFDRLMLRCDHQNDWISRHAFEAPIAIKPESGHSNEIAKIEIPLRKQRKIPLGLNGYQESNFSFTYSMKPDAGDFHMVSRTYLDLVFPTPVSWSDVLDEVRRWRWFFSLATRTTVEVEELTLCRRTSNPEKPFHHLPVWIERHYPLDPKAKRLTALDFHFTYDNIESSFPEVIRRWRAIQESWGAVLHRFFAIAEPRKLWINERFLFLAQAIESLHRARSGDVGDNFTRAAKEAHLNSPASLQKRLGKRQIFIDQLHRSRNFWTHYGKPGPGDDPLILEGRDLEDLNEKLRWVIEAAILMEIGIPEECVAMVWDERWKQDWINFE